MDKGDSFGFYRQDEPASQQSMSPQTQQSSTSQSLSPLQSSLPPPNIPPPLSKLTGTSQRNNTFKFKHPFTATLAGPTSCGKTSLLFEILKRSQEKIEPSPDKIYWFYKRWQPLYSMMMECISNIEFIRGIPTDINDDDYFDSEYNNLLIFDDLMENTTNSSAIAELYTEGSHHRNLSVINLVQNLYHKGKQNRTINLNNHYIILFKNPRDQLIPTYIARQMYPENNKHFINKYKEATKPPYGYLLIDLKQDTDDLKRLQTNILDISTNQQGDLVPMKNDKTQPNQDKDKVNYCSHCGIMFASEYDVRNHVMKGCSLIYQPQKRKFDMDSSVFREWITDARSQNDMKRDTRFNEYRNSGYTAHEAENLLKDEIKDEETFIQKYKSFLHNLITLEKNSIHNDIITTTNELLAENLKPEKAIQLAIDEHKPKFDSMF